MNFLFLCTGNSCRSILSEVLFNHRAPTGFQACSAGSKPTGKVHPYTIKTLKHLGLSTENLSSKTMQDCKQYKPDIVISVCEQAALEPCPLYLGRAIKAHWGLEDPSHLDLTDDEKLKAFLLTVDHINRRLDAFFSLDLNALNREELITEINKISNIE